MRDTSKPYLPSLWLFSFSSFLSSFLFPFLFPFLCFIFLLTLSNYLLSLSLPLSLVSLPTFCSYEVPEEISKCGKAKKTCSAGKLFKRAEENRKAEMHDDAGADLLRALRKKGLETDFVAKCEQSLGRALEAVQRQREREAKEEEEQIKADERAEEERLAMEAATQRKQDYDAAWKELVAALADAKPEEVAAATAESAVGPNGEVLPVAPSAAALHMPAIVSAFVSNDHEAALSLIKKVPGNQKTENIWVIEARCHEVLQSFNLALSAAGNLIQKYAHAGAFVPGSPIMLAVQLGANAAMQMGLSDKALKFYQSVLKFDPDQEQARKQYRGLKKVIKALGAAEDQIKKGYNKAASVHIDDCLSALKGLDVDSPLFRSKIQLKLCTILSGLNKAEEALKNCDSALAVREGEGVSDVSKKEAFLARGEALLLDDNYDGAVSDFRSALNLVSENDREMKQELNHKLQQTMRLADDWNGGKKDHQFNEHRGFPDGKPPQRDNVKILGLPVNLDESSKEIKCLWLKKQFKARVRQVSLRYVAGF